MLEKAENNFCSSTFDFKDVMYTSVLSFAECAVLVYFIFLYLEVDVSVVPCYPLPTTLPLI